MANISTKFQSKNVALFAYKSLTNFLPSAASLIDNIDVVEENMTLIVNEIAKRENWKID